MRSDEGYAIGVDYGTESGRVLILNTATGDEESVATVDYPSGVIDAHLPSSGASLPPDWALQDPRDYLTVLSRGIPEALKSAGVDGSSVIGLGIDFTSCTALPVTADGTAFSSLEEWRDDPHAWVKLWKHHAAQPYADRLNEVAVERSEPFIARYGGRISSEWYFPKLLEIWDQDRSLYDAMHAFVEATDWVIWQLTGKLVRAACSAGYKACWSSTDGLPPDAYFEAAFPGFSEPSAKLGTTFLPPGTRAGTLRADLAAQLGLTPNVAVAVGNVDSFVSVPGAGVQRPGAFVMVVGTSICDMVIDRDEVLLPGITGVVEDGILPGYFGYEAGQPAVGDMFGWFVERVLKREEDDATEIRKIFSGLEGSAGTIAPGSTGLVALDWWNGNRSILTDADLSGVIAGLTLSTTKEQIFRAMLESVAFGTRRIVENFKEHGVDIRGIVACGGIAERSTLLMQLISDATRLPVSIPDSTQVPARGAALYGAVAAGPAAGGFASIEAAVDALPARSGRTYAPSAAASVYDDVYDVYRFLHDALGKDHVEWLHRLKQIRREALSASMTPPAVK